MASYHESVTVRPLQAHVRGVSGSGEPTNPFRTPPLTEGTSDRSSDSWPNLSAKPLLAEARQSRFDLAFQTLVKGRYVHHVSTVEQYRGLLAPFPSSSASEESTLSSHDLDIDMFDHIRSDTSDSDLYQLQAPHAFALGRKEPKPFKVLKVALKYRIYEWLTDVEQARQEPFTALDVLRELPDDAAFLGTKYMCCQCGHVDHLCSNNTPDMEHVLQFTCIQCEHEPCFLCQYDTAKLEKLSGQMLVTVKKSTPGHPWLCCSCGTAGLTTAVHHYPEHAREQIFDFRGSTCSTCKHDCCATCACFRWSDAIKWPSDAGIKNDEDAQETCNQDADGAGEQAGPKSRLQKSLRLRDKPLRHSGPTRQVMRSLSLKVMKIIGV